MLFTTKAFEKERQHFPLWIPVFFGFGAAFYFEYLTIFPAIFIAASLLFLINRSLIIAACAIFLLGGLYADFYEEPPQLNGNIFVEVTGRVESTKTFYNPINHLEGINLTVSDLEIKKPEFVKKQKNENKKHKAKNKSKKNKSKKTKSKKSKSNKAKKRKSKKNKDEFLDPQNKEENNEKNSEENSEKIEEKKIKVFNKNEIKSLINLANYQDIDREFLDHSNSYQQEIPQNLKRISVNLVRNNPDIAVNDKISFRALLAPSERKDFPSDYDYTIDAKIKKIAAYGFVSGEINILQKHQISNLDDWFLSLREKIRQNIYSTLSGDQAEVAIAFLIGDQRSISKELSQGIRNSGLSHLLSISGFHLSLAGVIFFFVIRFFLSRSENLALNFDLKKIASLIAIFAVYFYLKIAGSPVPAERSFIFVFFALLALFFNEKLDAKRATMFGAFILILINPYVIFSVSFHLSFAAILVLATFSKAGRNYFWQIALTSVIIQIAVAPLLMHYFRNLSLLGLIANLAAIPLTSFFLMPTGFLALFLMPLGLAKPALLLMNLSIIGLEKIIYFTTSLPYSYTTTPWLPDYGVVIAIVGILLVCLSAKLPLRIIGIAIFLTSFLTILTVKKPDIIFEQHQKFFAIYSKENGLIFSKKLRPSKQRQLWMKQFDETEFKTLNCPKDFCKIEAGNKEILVLLQRNKIDEICKINADIIVNLSKKYQLPKCFSDQQKTIIDNKDFLLRGTQFLFFKNKEFGTDKIHRSSEEERDDKSDFGDDKKEVDGDLEDNTTNDQGGNVEAQILE